MPTKPDPTAPLGSKALTMTCARIRAREDHISIYVLRYVEPDANDTRGYTASMFRSLAAHETRCHGSYDHHGTWTPTRYDTTDEGEGETTEMDVDLARSRYRAADDVLRVVEAAATLDQARDKAREVCEGFWRFLMREQRKAAVPTRQATSRCIRQ